MVAATPPPEPIQAHEHVRYAVGEGPATVISVSLPKGTVDALRETVGKRGVSAAVSAAMERELRERARDEYIGEHVRRHGEFTEEEMEEVHAIWARATEKEAQWRASHQS